MKINYSEYFTEDATTKVSALLVDEDGQVIEQQKTCTKPNCSCAGKWWESTGKIPYGKTKIIWRT